MMINEKNVSVIIPVVNPHFSYFKQAIDSIRFQTYKNIEIVVVDGSKDNRVKDFLFSIGDDRIQYYYRKRNGISDALNYGVEKAKGEYIARMDADDISHPERIEKQIRYLENHTNIDVLGSAYRMIDSNGNPIRDCIFQEQHGEICAGLIFDNPIGHPTVMFRKKIFDSGWKYEDVFAEDYHFWTRLVFHFKFANLSDILLSYRKHDESKSLKSENKLLESVCSSTKAYLELLFDEDLDCFKEIDFIKTYQISEQMKLMGIDHFDFVKRQYLLLHHILRKRFCLGNSGARAIEDEAQKRWKVIIDGTQCLQYYELELRLLADKDFIEDIGVLNHLLNENIQIIAKMKQHRISIVLYGYGEIGKAYLSRFIDLNENGIIRWSLKGIVDKHRVEIHHKDYEGVTVNSECLKSLNVDLVLISSYRYLSDIQMELRNLGIPDKRIARVGILDFMEDI